MGFRCFVTEVLQEMLVMKTSLYIKIYLNTVKVPERVQFWHENVHLSANHSSAFLSRRAVIG